jgi:hypothetical protein
MSVPNIKLNALPSTSFQPTFQETTKLKDFFKNNFPRITDIISNALDISKKTGFKSYVRFESLLKYGLATIQDLRLLCDGLKGFETIDRAMTSIEKQLEELKQLPLSEIDPNAIYASLIMPLKDFSKGEYLQDWATKGIDFGDLEERYSIQLKELEEKLESFSQNRSKIGEYLVALLPILQGLKDLEGEKIAVEIKEYISQRNIKNVWDSLADAQLETLSAVNQSNAKYSGDQLYHLDDVSDFSESEPGVYSFKEGKDCISQLSDEILLQIIVMSGNYSFGTVSKRFKSIANDREIIYCAIEELSKRMEMPMKAVLGIEVSCEKFKENFDHFRAVQLQLAKDLGLKDVDNLSMLRLHRKLQENMNQRIRNNFQRNLYDGQKTNQIILKEYLLSKNLYAAFLILNSREEILYKQPIQNAIEMNVHPEFIKKALTLFQSQCEPGIILAGFRVSLQSFLFQAADLGHWSLAKELFVKSKEERALDARTYSQLMISCLKGKEIQWFKALFNEHADKITETDMSKIFELALAIEGEQKEIIQLLLEQYFPESKLILEQASQGKIECIDDLDREWRLLNTNDRKRKKAMMLCYSMIVMHAIEKGHLELAKKLLNETESKRMESPGAMINLALCEMMEGNPISWNVISEGIELLKKKGGPFGEYIIKSILQKAPKEVYEELVFPLLLRVSEDLIDIPQQSQKLDSFIEEALMSGQKEKIEKIIEDVKWVYNEDHFLVKSFMRMAFKTKNFDLLIKMNFDFLIKMIESKGIKAFPDELEEFRDFLFEEKYWIDFLGTQSMDSLQIAVAKTIRDRIKNIIKEDILNGNNNNLTAKKIKLYLQSRNNPTIANHDIEFTLQFLSSSNISTETKLTFLDECDKLEAKTSPAQLICSFIVKEESISFIQELLGNREKDVQYFVNPIPPILEFIFDRPDQCNHKVLEFCLTQIERKKCTKKISLLARDHDYAVPYNLLIAIEQYLDARALRRILENACRKGDEEIIQHFIKSEKTDHFSILSDIVECGAKKGNEEIVLAVLNKIDVIPYSDAIKLAIENGHLKLVGSLLNRLTILSQSESPISQKQLNKICGSLISSAAKAGHLDLVKEGFNRISNCNDIEEIVTQAYDAAEKNNHEEIIQYLVESGKLNDSLSSVISYETGKGDKEYVLYLLDQEFESYVNNEIDALELVNSYSIAIKKAIKKGHKDLLRAIIDKLDLVVRELNHADIIQGINDGLILSAARTGDLDLLKKRYSKGHAVTNDEQGCFRDVCISAFHIAEKHGHDEILQYLYEVDPASPRLIDVISWKARKGDIECLDLLISSPNHIKRHYAKALEQAKKNGHDHLFETLLNLSNLHECKKWRSDNIYYNKLIEQGIVNK